MTSPDFDAIRAQLRQTIENLREAHARALHLYTEVGNMGRTAIGLSEKLKEAANEFADVTGDTEGSHSMETQQALIGASASAEDALNMITNAAGELGTFAAGLAERIANIEGIVGGL